MKISAITMAYNDEAIIKGTIRCLQPFVDKHIILLNEKPFFGDPTPPDKTEEICNKMGCDVIKGVWEEHTQRNIGLSLCQDSDWILIFDSDEMMTKDDLGILIEALPYVEKDVIAAHSKVYWKNTDYKLSPSPEHKIVIAVRPNVHFTAYRNVNVLFYYYIKQEKIIHHHLSWCEPKDIYKKVVNYNHANLMDGKKWYEEVYKNWEYPQRITDPMGAKFIAVYDPLPQELKELLN